MEKRLLGKSGLLVSRLAFGSLTVGPLQANLPIEEGARIIAYAFDRGVNFIDTAQYYQNYEYIGRALELAKNKDIVLSTKSYAYSKEQAVEAVEEARRKTGKDVIDVFMLHETESALTIRGHMEAVEYYAELRAKGIIKALGVSTHHVAGVLGAVKAGVFDVIHPIFNLKGLGIADGTRDDMEAAIKNAAEENIGIFTMKSLGGGNFHYDAQSAFDFVLSKDYIHSVAVGMQSIAEVDANIAYFEGKGFSETEKERLSEKKRRLHIESWCEGCGRCTERCHQKALKIGAGEKAEVDTGKCVLCGYCAPVCPVFAIKVF